MTENSTNTAAARRRAARAAERDEQAAAQTARLPHPADLSGGPGGLTWTAPTGPPAVGQPGPATGYAGLAEPAALPPITAHGPTAARWAGDPETAA